MKVVHITGLIGQDGLEYTNKETYRPKITPYKMGLVGWGLTFTE
jgi:hypothetical protein